ncbi:hypothetical protein A7A76_21490 [Lysobacter enzymogenes]|uniref:hypothetical protein n=1 Tax=Lysobacter enzymogenes TaxID=69 RepID=UPI0019D1D4B1|nr:hypothetical protein [Lysobacter enzymogenes]MBN7137296.1 hypothetical protein [Lysobacter enzymogenes]
MKTGSLFGGAIVVAAMAFALAACSNAVKDPKYERNPNPKQKYVVTAKVEGAPGPFRMAIAGVQYRIGPTQSCMPPAEPISGVFPTQSRSNFGSPVRNLSGAEFEFDVYLDGMVSKDYFGRGVCTWQIELVSLTLRPANDDGERKFDLTIGESDVTGGGTLVLYARREKYATPVENAYDDFETAIEKEYAVARYGSDLSKFFTITVSAKESGRDH